MTGDSPAGGAFTVRRRRRCARSLGLSRISINAIAVTASASAPPSRRRYRMKRIVLNRNSANALSFEDPLQIPPADRPAGSWIYSKARRERDREGCQAAAGRTYVCPACASSLPEEILSLIWHNVHRPTLLLKLLELGDPPSRANNQMTCCNLNLVRFTCFDGDLPDGSPDIDAISGRFSAALYLLNRLNGCDGSIRRTTAGKFNHLA